MNLILFDTEDAQLSLRPFTFTRPVASIRVGIYTISEKWAERLNTQVSFKTADYLSHKFPCKLDVENLMVDARICPDTQFINEIKKLNIGEALFKNETLLAYIAAKDNVLASTESLNFDTKKEYQHTITTINHVWNIFQFNATEISADLALIKTKRKSIGIQDPHTIVYGKENVFVEEGASIRAAIINAEKGPVYIGKNAVVHEGAIINGAFALCEGAQVSMGAKMRGDSTIGPFSRVGGEVSNSVIFGYSSKGHDGYLGNSVLGEWCNLGAGTNTSNLKNDYSEVKVWSYAVEGFRKSGLQFCGLIMGDHSKSAINTMFNTGTVVGVSSNIFGPGFPRNFIPSFSWGGSNDFTTYQLSKAHTVAERVMSRRDLIFDSDEARILQEVFNRTAHYRYWDK